MGHRRAFNWERRNRCPGLVPPAGSSARSALALAALIAACQDGSREPARPEPLNREPAAASGGVSQEGNHRSSPPLTASTERDGPAPAFDQVRYGAVRGRCRGRDFVAQTLFFEPRFNSWALVIADREPPNPLGLLPPGAESIHVTDLPERMATGRYEKPLSPGGGFWQIRSTPSAERTESWNARNGYALELTHWDVAEFDPAKASPQRAGTASGRVIVVYESDGQPCGVDGTFSDALVRYRRRPRPD